MSKTAHSPIDLSVLPALPGVAREILMQFSDEFITGEQVSRTVQQDPGITARLVSIANSAYFGLATPVTDMQEIVIRVLGVDNVRALALSLVASQVFEVRSTSSFDLRDFWLRAFLGAEAARRAASQIPVCDDQDRSMAYTTGFCRDIGLLALAAIAPVETEAILEKLISDDASGSEEHYQALFREQFGLTPEAATADLASQWGMPKAMCQAYTARANGDESVPLSMALTVVEDVVPGLFARDAEPLATDAQRLSLVQAATPGSAYEKKIRAVVERLI